MYTVSKEVSSLLGDNPEYVDPSKAKVDLPIV